MKTIEQQAEEYAKQQKIKRTQGQSVAVCIKNEDLQYDAFIAGFEAATKWISVDDELPKKDFNHVQVGKFSVDCILKGVDEEGDIYLIGYYNFIEKKWQFNYNNEIDFIPTHWLPIPKLPTK